MRHGFDRNDGRDYMDGERQQGKVEYVDRQSAAGEPSSPSADYPKSATNQYTSGYEKSDAGHIEEKLYACKDSDSARRHGSGDKSPFRMFRHPLRQAVNAQPDEVENEAAHDVARIMGFDRDKSEQARNGEKREYIEAAGHYSEDK